MALSASTRVAHFSSNQHRASNFRAVLTATEANFQVTKFNRLKERLQKIGGAIAVKAS